MFWVLQNRSHRIIKKGDFSSTLSYRPRLENHVKKGKTIVADTVKAMKLQIQKEEHMH